MMAAPPTTRLQVSGHRFLVRRMEHALVRRDVRMLDDPLRAQTLSLIAGAVLATVAVAVCAVLALVRPAGELGDATVVVVRETGALYVRVDDVWHPVFNLASARLIVGAAAEPRMVAQRTVDAAVRGPQVGIAGAPQQISLPLSAQESTWSVCDDSTGTTTVAVGALRAGTASARGVLVTPRGAGPATTFLLYGGWRARVDLRHPAVVHALRLDGVVPRPVSAALVAAIPEAPAIEPPRIADLGRAGPAELRGYPIGSVVTASRADGSVDYFVVLADGVQRIGEVAADLIRFTDSQPGARIPAVSPDLVAALPVVDTLPVGTFPERGGVTDKPVVCARWRSDAFGSASHTDVVVSDAVPVSDRASGMAQADADGPAVDAVAVPAGRSAYVLSVGLTGDGRSTGSLFLLTDAGVLFGIDDADAAARLGLTADPATAPWPILAGLPRGPELSTTAASVARDALTAP